MQLVPELTTAVMLVDRPGCEDVIVSHIAAEAYVHITFAANVVLICPGAKIRVVSKDQLRGPQWGVVHVSTDGFLSVETVARLAVHIGRNAIYRRQIYRVPSHAGYYFRVTLQNRVRKLAVLGSEMGPQTKFITCLVIENIRGVPCLVEARVEAQAVISPNLISPLLGTVLIF
jgi:hypothetical protein